MSPDEELRSMLVTIMKKLEADSKRISTIEQGIEQMRGQLKQTLDNAHRLDTFEKKLDNFAEDILHVKLVQKTSSDQSSPRLLSPITITGENY